MNLYKLPTSVNPTKDAQQKINYSGYYPSDIMKRLKDSVSSIEDNIEVNWQTIYDYDKKVVLVGNVKCIAILKCLRCLKLYKKNLTIDFKFSPVASIGKMEELNSDYEYILYDKYGEVNILEAIEDELILSLPLIPKHDLSECSIQIEKYSFGNLSNNDESKRNPFAILENLKTK